ncbi:MAG: 6-phosphofructokinase, partial [Planctomycetota bacterium]
MFKYPDFHQSELAVPTLGPPRHPSPLRMSNNSGDGVGSFRSDQSRLLYEPRFLEGDEIGGLSFELAGPRERLFFDPAKVKAAIVTCGGLCPGLNNIIRTLTYELIFNYGVSTALGLRDGFRGLNPDMARAPLQLNPDSVEGIHHLGGTILSTSRGPQDPAVSVEFLKREG